MRRAMAMPVAMLGLAAVMSAASGAETRTWTDASGEFKIEARLVAVADGKVTLKRTDGVAVIMPIETLSAADQAFLRSKPAELAGAEVFRGRTDARLKTRLLEDHGGSEGTEAAVGAALEWLRRQQAGDGLWSLRGPYEDGALNENQLAATAMAMLAFQGAGSTHLDGKYRAEVARATQALLKRMDAEGAVHQQGSPSHHRMYTQAQATLALGELYGMTKDEKLKPTVQRLIDYAARHQSRQGGWRYVPGQDTDTSVTGWFVRALHTGRAAGLDVPEQTLARVAAYLDKAGSEGGARYAYRPGERATLAMTAEGLLCRQHLGWKRDHAPLLDGAAHLREHMIDHDQEDSYYAYHATQVMYHLGGDQWRQWNAKLRDTLMSAQVARGAEAGSWLPKRDKWGSHGGRLYLTCLNTWMLQVYYRNLPLYEAAEAP